MKRDEDGTNKRRKCGWIRKKEKKRKGKREGTTNKGEREESDREKEREKGERETKREIFPAFRRLNLDGLRVKVDPFIAGYAWVPKSWSFVKLREVKNFPTWIISNLKVIYWQRRSLGLKVAGCFSPKILGLNIENFLD